jgi:signal transduction histidine kinase
MFASVIGYHLSAIDKMQKHEATLLDERETSALREQFIAVLSHDLRNPLAAIDGGMRLLLKTPLNERAQAVVGMVQSSTARMAALIDNVMDFARGRLGGGISLAWEPNASLEKVLLQVISEIQASVPEREFDVQLALPVAVNCDPRRIGQLVSNLLGNAVTYGPADRPIRVYATVSGGSVELSVANAGEPIPEAAMAKIFQPFTRGTLRPSMQGLGLGLYIAHEIAIAHGGSLTVMSDHAETRFTFGLPLVVR